MKPLIRFILALSNLHRRGLAFFLYLLGPKRAYRFTGWGASIVYGLLLPFRERSEAQCHAAVGHNTSREEVVRIAKQSFIHRSHNLTDLMLASRLLRQDNFERYGGQIPEPFLERLHIAQRERRPVILLTGYYGSFDLLPIFLGYNGIKATAAYLPHSNSGFDRYRKRIRGQSGCEMIPIEKAAARLESVLDNGGTISIVADHHVEKRGVDLQFLGIPTRAMRTVGLLAHRYDADVVIAELHRVQRQFLFEIKIEDVIVPKDWQESSDPITLITKRYTNAIERMVRGDPTQYLWGYARWGEEHARRVTEQWTNAAKQTESSKKGEPR
ncbi:MAG: lysophospholipid acyltransferase family protein [Planctomycetes bacterium]|nr:lysophospholipid acyltransferase family protein [Planctomycetota bacterium]